jgi:hypothetical protein
MKVERLSEASDKSDFLKRFSFLTDKINLDETSRPKSNPLATLHLLMTFDHVDKELIIISDGDKELGRVCINTTQADENFILFGFIEYERAQADILKRLMDEVEIFAKKKGKKSILGPIDINVWFGNRFKKSGFDNQRSWEPNSPKEYLEDILKLNYQLDQDYLSAFYQDGKVSIDRTKPAYDKAIEQGFTFRNLDPSTTQETQKLYQTNIKGFCHNYFYEPITYEEYVGTHIKALDGFDFQYSFWVMDPTGNELGYVFSYPDEDRIIIKSLVMDPNSRGAKLSSALVHRSLLQGYNNGLIKACGACVRKGNVSEHFFDHLGQKEHEHLYTLVRKNL